MTFYIFDKNNHKIPNHLYLKYWANKAENVKRMDLSSHWKYYLKESSISKTSDIYAIKSIGLANFIPFNFVNSVKNSFLILQIIGLLLKFKVKPNVILSVFKVSFVQRKVFDFDLAKQALAINFLIPRLDSKLSHIAIIGDGFANFGSIASMILPNSRISFINLGENLFLDAIMMHKLHPNSKNHKLSSDLTREDSRFNYIEATNLSDINDVDLFINIASFGEMTQQTIIEYFIWMKKNASKSAYLYSCNRISKLHPDGSIYEHSWLPLNILEGKMILEEMCAWYQNYPTGRWPAFKVFDGPMIHFLHVF
jgi:hypothetical protein